MPPLPSTVATGKKWHKVFMATVITACMMVIWNQIDDIYNQDLRPHTPQVRVSRVRVRLRLWVRLWVRLRVRVRGDPVGFAMLGYTLRTAHCTLHTAHCTLHTAHRTLHTAHCTLHTAHCTLRTAHCALHTAHCTNTEHFFTVEHFFARKSHWSSLTIRTLPHLIMNTIPPPTSRCRSGRRYHCCPPKVR